MKKYSSAEQREKLQRGLDFQAEIRRSWRLIPGSWRFKLPDGGGNRPADELILLRHINILAEAKRTAGDRFELGFLRTNQGQGLVAFDRVNARSFGLVFISFLSLDGSVDEAYAFRLTDALDYMKILKRQYIGIKELKDGVIPRARLIRLQLDDGPGYDLSEVETCYKYT